MVNESLILFEYEEILMGKKKNFDVSFCRTSENCWKVTGVIWRYAIEKLLRWTPAQALLYLNNDIIHKLRLDLTYDKIDYKYSTKKFFDLRIILRYAFPEAISYNLEDDAKQEYERVAKIGKWEDVKERVKFHKNYFDGVDGIKRAAVVLQYAISISELAEADSFELYKFFANRREATIWLTKKEIETNIKALYSSPLEYLHYSLPPEKVNPVYYLNEYFRSTYLT